MRLRLNMNVVSQEGQPLGRIKYVLLDRQNLHLGGIVVQNRRWLLETRETLVPLDVCLPALLTDPTTELQLDLSVRRFETLKPYWDYQGEDHEDESSSTWLHCNPEAFFIYHPPHPYNDMRKIRNCEPELMQFSGSAQVYLNDGGRGRVREFFFGLEQGWPQPMLTSLTASCNSSSSSATIPASWIKKIEDERFILDLSRAELSERINWPARLAASLEKVKQE